MSSVNCNTLKTGTKGHNKRMGPFPLLSFLFSLGVHMSVHKYHFTSGGEGATETEKLLRCCGNTYQMTWSSNIKSLIVSFGQYGPWNQFISVQIMYAFLEKHSVWAPGILEAFQRSRYSEDLIYQQCHPKLPPDPARPHSNLQLRVLSQKTKGFPIQK